MLSSIRERYLHTLDQIAKAAAGSGRIPEEVRLVVVSKTQPLEVIRAAIAAGISMFGENYAEEALGKIAALKETEVEWHMIGHVQSRKADIIARNFSMLHSLDSSKLAEKMERICSELNRTLPVLLEFNVSGEESKFGFSAWEENHWSDLKPDIEKILSFSHLHVNGLMTMPPLFEDPERSALISSVCESCGIIWQTSFLKCSGRNYPWAPAWIILRPSRKGQLLCGSERQF